jgi:GT2 family glycosyltransferase
MPQALHSPPSGVHLVLRSHNDGFAAGVNAGWRAAAGRWLLLLNPDIVAEPGFVGRILERIRHFEGRQEGAPGIVGFRLRNEDGTDQPSVGHDPNLFRSLRGLFLPRARRKYQPAAQVRAGRVPWVTGACVLVDTNVLEQLSGMDEDFFLYYEEVALCRSARLLGRRVEFDPSVEVTHLRPLQNRAVTPKMRVITRHSKLLYYRKHRSRREFASLTRIVAAEAGVRGFWARLAGRRDHAQAWSTIGTLARSMRRGAKIRGRDVLVIAERGAAAIAGLHGIRNRTAAASGAVTHHSRLDSAPEDPGRASRQPVSSAHFA